MVSKECRTKIREKKHMKIRNRFSGTPERPRLAVFRSNNHMYAQIIDDTVGHTLVAASTLEKDVKADLEKTNDVAAAAKSGKELTLTLGYSHPVVMIDPEGVETVLDGQNKITVKGIDKEKVGQYAAEIRDKRRPEPYKGKGIMYADEVIRRKVGKTGKK